jgi:hypothetical protein
MLYINDTRIKIFCILFIIAIILHLYKFCICKFNKKDIFSINKDKSLIVNGWATSHFLINFLLGYFFGDEVVFAFILGVLWEMYEFIYSLNPPIIIDIYKNICKNETENIILYNPYDIFINSSGLILGKIASNQHFF